MLAIVAVVVLFGGRAGRPPLAPGAGEGADPLAYTAAREEELAAAAARGHAHVLYAKSPGGARASAQRTAAHRPLVEAAAETAGVQPDTLEAMVLLESAGRDDAIADPQLEGAVGLTQILAETGRNLLGMTIDTEASRRIGRSLRRAERKGDRALVERLKARRRSVDERFDPPKALAATARYLLIAREELHREDLAVVSYHMGIGNVQSALRAYGEDEVSYARLYFDSTPLRHERAYAELAALGDDSATYLWRVAAAREIMRLYRSDPAQLDRVSHLQNEKNSAEEVLHPADDSEQFTTPVGPARRLRRRPDRRAAARRAARATACAIDRGMGELAGRLGRRARRYRGLREPALALFAYLGAGVKTISGDAAARRHEHACATSATSARCCRRNREATPNYSLHTTGWSFDVMRTYSLARAGAGVRVHARAPAVARPDRVGARAGRDPRHRVTGRRAAGRGDRSLSCLRARPDTSSSCRSATG